MTECDRTSNERLDNFVSLFLERLEVRAIDRSVNLQTPQEILDAVREAVWYAREWMDECAS